MSEFTEFTPDSKFMDRLHKLAESSHDFRCRISAILADKEIISIGFNKRKSSPFQKRFATNNHRIFLHAEIACLIDFLRKFSEDRCKFYDVYILRINKNGELMDSLPCPGCLGAMEYFGIRSIIFYKDQQWRRRIIYE